ncbi:MAG: hypothetical protein ACO3LH_02585, partial [Steroidobacteraceae bacterium]
MYVLHGSLGSPYVARVVLAARHKGLDLKPQMPPALKSAAYRALKDPVPLLSAIGERISTGAGSIARTVYLIGTDGTVLFAQR